MRLGGRALLVVLAVMATACRSSADPRPLTGQLEVMGVWSGIEQERFQLVLDEFERQSGVRVVYTSAGHGGVAGALATSRAEGRLPDVAFLPQPGLLKAYASDGALVALGNDAVEAVRRNYGSEWQRLSSFDGRLFGVPFKAANKSLIWYDVAAFEQAGVVPPATLAGLARVSDVLATQARPAFAVGGRDGWTLTDWFENLYLRVAGTERYDLLADHRIPWTDESVTTTLRLLLDHLHPDRLSGGVDTVLATSFDESVRHAFSGPGSAAMLFEGDFVAAVLAQRGDAEVGVDVDVFPFPAFRGVQREVVGGGDIAVLLRPSPQGDAFMRFLATPEAATPWARAGGFISPNLNLDLSIYRSPVTRRLARAVLDAGDLFRFDLSDLTPASFGGTEGKGMRRILQDLLVIRDVVVAAQALEAEARAAYGP
ncbi:MAG TPA: ABC transporter substrate-binding protein [Acidimicrobiales bacterium]